MAETSNHTRAARSRKAGLGPGRAAAIGGRSGSLFCSREEAARLLGMSVGGLGLAMQRGECEGLYTRVGRRILFCLPAIQLRALGVKDVGAFCKSLGVKNLSSLLEFLGGHDGT